MADDKTQTWWQRLRIGGDKPLWIIFVVLAFVSMFVVYSSTTSSLYGSTTAGHHLTRFFKQLIYVIIGLVAVWAVHRLDYQRYGRWAYAAYIVSLGFMVLTMFFGVNKFGAQRWLEVPILGITFQPSDLLKVTTVMVLSLQLAGRQLMVEKHNLIPSLALIRRNRSKAWRLIKEQTFPVFGPILISCGFIVPENMSTALLMGATCVVILIIGRVKWADIARFLIISAVFGSVMLGGMLLMEGFSGEESRLKTWGNRITALFNPEKLEQQVTENGNKKDYFYQINQAKIAIAMGKFRGRGAGQSAQRHMLPKAESDYAFAFLVEEWGFVGALLVVVMYLWIFYRAIVIFNKCGTAFPCLLVLGLAFLITFQALLNMMVATGLMFQTGLALPLISQGGSSELFTSVAIGMILGVSRQIEEKTLTTPRGESMLENNRKK